MLAQREISNIMRPALIFMCVCMCVMFNILTTDRRRYVDRKGDTLAIDGSGWVFKILEGQRVDHSGDYDLLHEGTLREIARLRDVSTSFTRRVSFLRELRVSRRRVTFEQGSFPFN